MGQKKGDFTQQSVPIYIFPSNRGERRAFPFWKYVKVSISIDVFVASRIFKGTLMVAHTGPRPVWFQATTFSLTQRPCMSPLEAYNDVWSLSCNQDKERIPLKRVGDQNPYKGQEILTSLKSLIPQNFGICPVQR